MKTKKYPLQVKSGNYLDQALMEGLNKKQRDYAKKQVKKFEDFAVPYGLIRKAALDIK